MAGASACAGRGAAAVTDGCQAQRSAGIGAAVRFGVTVPAARPAGEIINVGALCEVGA